METIRIVTALDEEIIPPKPFYDGILPHYHPGDSPIFVTSRLHGSIPQSEMKKLLWHFQLARTPEEKLRFFKLYDDVLDKNGPYFLQETTIRDVVHESLRFIGERDLYIWAYTIMPNHVHLVAKLRDTTQPVFKVMQSFKRFTARKSNIILDRTGKPFWNRENYDHVVREGKLGNAIWYILLNPVKAGFVKHWRGWPGTYLTPECHGFD